MIAPVVATVAVDEALRTVARTGLPGVADPPVALADDDLDAFLAGLWHHRLSGLAFRAVETGVLHTSAAADERLWRAVVEARASCLLVEEHLERAAAVLERAGLGVVLLKGVAVARLDYPDPEDRVFGDADVLVEPGGYAEAVRVLTAAGYTPAYPPIGRRWDARYAKATTMTTADGYEIDVHRTLAEGFAGVRVPLAALVATGDRVEVRGRAFSALDAPNRLLHACIHAAASVVVRASSYRDVAQMALDGERWVRTVERAEAWGVEAFVAAGVRRAWDELGLDPGHPLAAWAAAVTPERGQRWAARLMGRNGELHKASALAALPVWRWPGYLGPLVWPSRAYLAARGLDRRGQLASSWKRLGR